MIQSAHLMTSRLCSITTIELPCFDQPLKQPNEQRDVVEMQAGGRLVEDEKVAALASFGAAVGQMPNELEPLRFAAGKGVQRLAEPEITEPDFLEHRERPRERFRFAERR